MCGNKAQSSLQEMGTEKQKKDQTKKKKIKIKEERLCYARYHILCCIL